MKTAGIVFDGKFRLYGAPSRSSGVECLRCSLPDMPYLFPTTSLPGALRWMRAHELRQHGAQLVRDEEATRPARRARNTPAPRRWLP